MQLVSLYSFDPTGRATANRIENQSITVTPPSSITDYSYVVPRGAPFYAESLVVKDGRSAGARTLVENVDYWCVIDFLSASVALNKRVSVGIALLDPGYSGTLYITYQAVGGNYSLADYSVLEELIRERYVVKHVSYEQIINLPEGFAPQWHQHQVADMVGMSQVVTTMTGVKTAIEGREGSYGQINAQIANHVGSSSAHTPAQIGLGNVKNYDVATLTEATNGAGNKYIVASVLKQYVQQMQPVLTGFITTANANLAFATKAQLNNFLTSTQSDSKYAFKSDSYTKSQIDAMINGIDISSSLSGYYTKVQSDAKYATVASIADYIKTTVADGRYATKLEMSGVYTKTQTDDKYPLKTASYTKGESDSRYLLSSALTGYITQTVGDVRYLQPAALNNYYAKTQSDARYPSKAEHDVLVNTTIPFSKFVLGNVMFERNASSRLPQLRIEYVQDNKSHTQFAPMFFMNDSEYKSGGGGVIDRRVFSTRVAYNNYSLPINWWIYRDGSMLHVSFDCDLPHYIAENKAITISTGMLDAKAATTPSMFNYGPISWWISANTSNVVVDYWYRLYGELAVDVANGIISFTTTVSTAQGGSSTMYSDRGFTGGFSLAIEDERLDTIMERWFNVPAAHHYTPIRYR